MAALPSDALIVDGQPSAEPAGPQRFAAPAALLVGAALVGCAGAIGVVETDGATGATSVPAAVWVLVLPGIIAALLTVLRPRIGAIFAAGAGALAVVRVLQDLFVLLEPAQVARPEFYFPSTTEVHPIGTSVPGAVLLLVGDLVLVAGGVLGARVAERGIRVRPGASSGFGFSSSPPVGVPDGATEPGPQGPANVRMVAVGLLGVAFAVVLTVQVPYRGGYLDDFYSLPSDLGSMLGPFLLALLAAGVVIRAGGLPRAMATALLGGAATMFLVPLLTAVFAVSGGARTALAGPPLVLPIGLLVMVGAGLLSRVRWTEPTSSAQGAHGTGSDQRDGAVTRRSAASAISAPSGAAGVAARIDPDQDGSYAVRPSEPIGLLGAGLGASAGVAAVLAPVFGMVRVNGGAPGPQQLAFLRTGPVVGSGVASVLTVPAVVAGAALLACALVAVLGRLLRQEPAVAAARAASTLLVVLPLAALAGPLSTLAVLSAGQSQTASALSGNAPAGFEVDTWTAGPGVWALVASLVLAIGAAVCAGTALGRRSEEMTSGPDDDAADDGRRRRWVAGAAVFVVALLSVSVSVWELPAGRSSTFFGGDAAWTCWLLVLGAGAAGVLIAVTRSAAVVMGAALGAAVLVVSRLIVPSGVSGAPGSVRPWGWYLGCVAVLVILGIGVLVARWVVSTAGPQEPMGSAPHVDNRSKPIRGR